MDRKAYSVAEAAPILGISKTTLYELIKAGQITTYSIGAKTLVPVQALDDFVDFYYRNGNLEVRYE